MRFQYEREYFCNVSFDKVVSRYDRISANIPATNPLRGRYRNLSENSRRNVG